VFTVPFALPTNLLKLVHKFQCTINGSDSFDLISYCKLLLLHQTQVILVCRRYDHIFETKSNLMFYLLSNGFMEPSAFAKSHPSSPTGHGSDSLGSKGECERTICGISTRF
jgi:hypothetical protein